MGTNIPMDIIKHFKNTSLEEQKYIEFHKYRYAYLIQQLEQISKTFKQPQDIKILDIGPAYQTSLIRKYFPEATVDTLGFNHPRNDLRPGEQHYIQDLNESNKPWEIESNQYHIIVFCEVIEHLYSKPELCLHKLYNALIKKGHIIIQTPNAVAIHKRIKLLFGLNPYNLLEESMTGHFREYTTKELKNMLTNVGLSTTFLSVKNYFNSSTSILNKLYIKLEAIIPGQLRDGITIVGVKEN